VFHYSLPSIVRTAILVAFYVTQPVSIQRPHHCLNDSSNNIRT